MSEKKSKEKMNLPENFQQLAGNWSGINRLHLPWIEDAPLKESKSEASVKTVAGKNYVQIEYDWVFDGQKQDGVLMFGFEKNSEIVNAVWIDSWHQTADFMPSKGKGKNRKITFKGFYKVPDHPDWCWRTDVEIESKDSFKIIMYNVSPEGNESLAVEMFFSRK